MRYHSTPEEASAAGALGWNIRCNQCGSYGAEWMPKLRPGWGSYAACPFHRDRIVSEQNRHARRMADLTAVNYEQTRSQPPEVAA